MYIHINIHIYIHTYIHIHTYIYIYLYIHIHIHICIYICTCVYKSHVSITYIRIDIYSHGPRGLETLGGSLWQPGASRGMCVAVCCSLYFSMLQSVLQWKYFEARYGNPELCVVYVLQYIAVFVLVCCSVCCSGNILRLVMATLSFAWYVCCSMLQRVLQCVLQCMLQWKFWGAHYGNSELRVVCVLQCVAARVAVCVAMCVAVYVAVCVVVCVAVERFGVSIRQL